MNEFQQDYENEKKHYIGNGIDISLKVSIQNVEHLFLFANLLRARYELELRRGSTTDEYIEMIKISSSFINK